MFNLIRERETVNRRAKIGLDVDGVIRDVVGYMIWQVKQDYGIEIKYEDIVNWDLSDFPKEYGARERLLGNDKLTRWEIRSQAEAYKGAENALDAYSDLVDIYLLTNQITPEDKYSTLEWFYNWDLGDSCKGIIFSKNKSEFANAFDYLIDDYHGNINEWNQAHSDPMSGIILTRPWNKDAAVGLAPRFDSLDVSLAHCLKSWNERKAYKPSGEVLL